MPLPKRYNTQENETRLSQKWQQDGTYLFDPDESGSVYSIDTPPATVSGKLHMGHIYSYSHPDFMARFWRMNGFRVFYPMGYDDNGLPTEKLVEKSLGKPAQMFGRDAFIEKCLQVSTEAEQDYEMLWKRLGLSIDWRYTYRTIDHRSRKISQLSFIDLHKKGLVYRKEAPAIWCSKCGTAIAQAELNDLERRSEFYTLKFHLVGDQSGQDFLLIATTRPELLPACVAVFVHPDDERYRHLVGSTCRVPLFGQRVPIIEDRDAEMDKGTGAVMCCTFGDTMDVAWWRKHDLPLVQAIDGNGQMSDACGEFAGLSTVEARKRIVDAMAGDDLILERQQTEQSVRVHERCDTAVEYIIAAQWFIRVLDFKGELLEKGRKIRWYPEHMLSRYTTWVENLQWDWCISRQRYYGVPFPLWYCTDCGEVILAEPDQLPVDPLAQGPPHTCTCGSDRFVPESDVMDTWATSSLTPQIAGGWLQDDGQSTQQDLDDRFYERLYERVYPFSLRPQAHEIIRTWAFYTIVKSFHHFAQVPWEEVLISGWGIAGEGMEKISKSRGGGSLAPMQIIEKYSADAVRYWAASAGPGRDSVISEEKIKSGARLITKLWNVARFCERFLVDYDPSDSIDILENEYPDKTAFTPADCWILSVEQDLIERVTSLYHTYDYAAAKSETESFFWHTLADNYLEMCKQRLYDETSPSRGGALFTLHDTLLTVLKLFAPLMPYVTETIYQGMFVREDDNVAGSSIHTSPWPRVDERWMDESAELRGELLVEVATAVRRYKSENNLALGTPLARLLLIVPQPKLAPKLRAALQPAIVDLKSITRAQAIDIVGELDADMQIVMDRDDIQVALKE